MDIAFYEIVLITDSERTRELGIAESIGVVVGKPPHTLGLEDLPALEGSQGQFAIDVAGTVFALDARQLVPTGQVLTRERFMSGEHISVEPERYRDDDGAGGAVSEG